MYLDYEDIMMLMDVYPSLVYLIKRHTSRLITNRGEVIWNYVDIISWRNLKHTDIWIRATSEEELLDLAKLPLYFIQITLSGEIDPLRYEVGLFNSLSLNINGRGISHAHLYTNKSRNILGELAIKFCDIRKE